MKYFVCFLISSVLKSFLFWRKILFKFLKKKKREFKITAPVSGTLINLCDVPDPVFSQKLMGDGFAVKLNKDEEIIHAPIEAKVVSLPESKHAVGLVTADGDEILLHIGIDTVNLKGQGFTAKVRQGDKVKQGQALIRLDRDILAKEKADLTTMVILTKLDSNHQNWDFVKEFGDQITEQDEVIRQ
ncbi:PTS glucose transporter subunit IIA [Lactobacillus sp. ESL0230]|nr:PTS glucose transporter subunit IIA [Lactobacillus sp. ESL0230]